MCACRTAFKFNDPSLKVNWKVKLMELMEQGCHFSGAAWVGETTGMKSPISF